mgnify:CR=1 FL=1
MIINGIGGRRFFVNLFSEFILNKFPKNSNTIIELADCENFLVIKGKTNYNEILDISKVKEEFISKYSELINKTSFHTIDLIEYNKSIEESERLFLQFYNSENPDYTSSQLKMFKEDNTKSYDENYEIMDNMIISNTFPFSISLNKGRLLYYYGKHIMYNIPPTYPTEKIEMIISSKSVEVYSNGDRDLTLESAILDMFDFEMGWISSEIEKVDLCDVIVNPLNDFEFLKRKVKDFIII